MNAVAEPTTAASKLDERLRSGQFVVTTELTPPVSTDPSKFIGRALALRGQATAVNVTDCPGAKVHMSGLIAANFLLRNGIEPIFQMACRDRNRLALQSDLLGALALGIRNVLTLTGDKPEAGDQPETKPVFDLDSPALLAVAHRMRSEKKLPSGTEIEGEIRLVLGTTDTPVDPPPSWNPKGLAAKLAAGADFVQTQFCVDMNVVRRYAARLLDLGIAQRLPVLIGVCPIPSARSARWMREKLFGTLISDDIIDRLERAADPKLEGKKICIDFMRQLAEIPGIAGAHVMAPQNPSAIPEVIAESGVTAMTRAAS